MTLEFVPRHNLILRSKRGGSTFFIRKLGSFNPADPKNYKPRSLLLGLGCLAGLYFLSWLPIFYLEGYLSYAHRLPTITYPSNEVILKRYIESGESGNSRDLKLFQDKIDEIQSNPPPTDESSERSFWLDRPQIKVIDDDFIPLETTNTSPLPRRSWRKTLEFSYSLEEYSAAARIACLNWVVKSRHFANWIIRPLGENWFTRNIALIVFLAAIVVGLSLVALYLVCWPLSIALAMATPLRLVLFLPTFFYRFSLKASAITYAPLFFVIEAPYTNTANPKEILQRIQFAWWPAMQREFAKFTAFILGINILFATALPTVKKLLPHPATEILAALHFRLTPTHLATAIILLCTFGVWSIARHSLWKLEINANLDLKPAAKTVKTLDRLRTILSIYTITCAIYWYSTTLFPHIPDIVPPEINWVFLPWNRA